MLNIKDLSADERPREKLLAKGSEALSKAELLAILIGSGSAKKNAVELMTEVLHDCDDRLILLNRLSVEELMKYNGIGEAKAISILAACELGKRRQREKAEERKQMGSAPDIYEYMHTRMQDLDVEEAWVLLLNQNFRLIKAVRISRGGITETAVDVRLIMKEAVLTNATVLALCHNHPSNNPHPSRDDDRLTERVRKACETMRYHFLDHVIVCDGAYYSYHEQGRI